MARQINNSKGGFKIHRSMLDSYEVYCLPNSEFVDAFYDAVNGLPSPLSRWVKPWNCRPPESEWAKIRSKIFARDDYTCRYCGARGKKLECDHVLPVSKGGDHSDSNLVTACRACNRNKRDKTLEEWRGGIHVAQA